MKVYVKKDKVLKLLGEGKIYSKKDLLLREFGDDSTESDSTNYGSADNPANISLSSNNGDISSPQKVSQSANAIAPKISGLPNAKASFSLEDAKWTPTPNINKNEPGADATLPADDNSPEAIGNAVEKAKQLRIGNIQVPLNQSVTPRKVMDEMRANSVPFTKKELTAFLKSL